MFSALLFLVAPQTLAYGAVDLLLLFLICALVCAAVGVIIRVFRPEWQQYLWAVASVVFIIFLILVIASYMGGGGGFHPWR